MAAITWTAPLALAAAALMAGASRMAAQSATGTAAKSSKGGAPHACSLLSDAEVNKLITRGRDTYGEGPQPMSIGGGTVCGYPGGAQIILFQPPKSQESAERFLQGFKKDKEPRRPLSGVGDRAFIMFPTPRDQYEDRGAFLVSNVGQYTIMVSMVVDRPALDARMLQEACADPKLSKRQKAQCDSAKAVKPETPESLEPAVIELAKVVVGKLR